MPMPGRLATLLPLVTALASCAALSGAPAVTAEATGSAYFSLSRPAIYKAGEGLLLAGRACRVARSTVLSPARVRVEHVSAAGEIVQSAHAFLPPIFRRADQRCADYSLKVAWQVGEGESVRACFDRGHACPAKPATAAVVPIAAPAPPPAPNATP